MNDATPELKASKIYKELLVEYKPFKLRLVLTNPATYQAKGTPL